MKKSKLVLLVILAMAISLWTPTPATARNVENSSSLNVGNQLVSAISFAAPNYLLDQNLSVEPLAAKVKVLVKNRTGGTLKIHLTGPHAYNFTLGTGGRYIYVLSGRYKYTVSAICGSATGNIRLRAGVIWNWSCK